jgi:hypothetical protein
VEVDAPLRGLPVADTGQGIRQVGVLAQLAVGVLLDDLVQVGRLGERLKRGRKRRSLSYVAWQRYLQR